MKPWILLALLLWPLTALAGDEADQVLKLQNERRQARRLAPLADHEVVREFAQAHAERMARGRFRHSNLRIEGVEYGMAGENIAYGQRTPEGVVATWMRSPGHRANILRRGFTHCGVGLARSRSGTPYWCVCFISQGKGSGQAILYYSGAP